MSDPAPTRSPRADGASDDTSSPLQILRNWLRSLRRGRNGEDSLRHAIEELIEEHEEEAEEAPLRGSETSLLLNILKLRDLTAYDVRVPRADIVAVPIDIELDALVRTMSTHGHSRLPVFRETLDDVIGMVHIKDVLACCTGDRPFNLASIARQVLFVAPSMRVLDLLLQMRLSRIHMALVVDEFGGIDGLITIEDLVEEIVGEIEDEHDFGEEEYIFRKNDREYTLKALTPIDEFNDYFYADFSDEEFDTIGGLIVHQLGHVPKKGEKVDIDRFRFIVLRADSRRVHLLKLILLPQSESSSESASARMD